MNNTHKWTACGLNADWCIQSWHYGTNQPNSVDGDYYVCDDEDGTFSVNRYFPSKEEDCTITIASFPTKAEAMAMVERNDKQELKVAEFCAGKTPEQIVEAIRELGGWKPLALRAEIMSLITQQTPNGITSLTYKVNGSPTWLHAKL